MKRFYKFISIFLIIIFLASCEISFGSSTSSSPKPSISSSIASSQTKEELALDILTINDTHGYLETSSSSSISKIGAYMDKYPEAIKLSIGDMFQGTGLSNLSKGKAMIEVMNEIGINAMVLGNHEFDWGIETILAYFDGNKENGEANFPLLAANVYDKNSNKLAHSKDYIIITKEDYKIGIIGVIGENLESSISVSSLNGHYFSPARPIVQNLVRELRNTNDCDMVILATHDGSSNNNLYQGLDIDLILNAHTHTEEKSTKGIPYLQAGCNAKYVGHIKTTLSNETKINSLSNISISNISNSSTKIDNLINEYIASLKDTLNEEIVKINGYNKNELIKLACEVYKDYFDCDMAFVNSGGFRTNWYNKTTITYNDMITMFPFDNEVKKVKMEGRLIKTLIDLMDSGKDIKTSSSLYKQNGIYYYDGNEIDENYLYEVVAIDYIFDKENYPFLSGVEIEHTNKYMRELLVDAFKEMEVINLN